MTLLFTITVDGTLSDRPLANSRIRYDTKMWTFAKCDTRYIFVSYSNAKLRMFIYFVILVLAEGLCAKITQPQNSMSLGSTNTYYIGPGRKSTVLTNDKNEVIEESADLLFHVLVLLASHDIKYVRILEELESRFGTSGIEEKKNRK